MLKVLFFIHDLCGGGAERVLINLANNLDPIKFEVTVIAFLGGGVYEKDIAPHIHYQSVFKKPFPGNSKIIKYLPSSLLHRMFIKNHYDIEIAFLEGAISKVISGCNNNNTKLISWIHTDQRNYKGAIHYFRNEKEAINCYSRFDRIVGVSKTVANRFHVNFPSVKEPIVLYNVLETKRIKELSQESITDFCFSKDEINIVTVGKISKQKGLDRLSRITLRLIQDGYPVHFFAIGTGSDQKEIEMFLAKNNITESFTFLGFQENPYKFVKNCDLYVCASLQEGFSTATTEALIVGTPICTVEVSGMREMLGNNEWGIVTNNDEDSLYEGIKRMIANREILNYYKNKSVERGTFFSMESTLFEVEKMLLML